MPFALVVVWSMWWFQLRSFPSSTPRVKLFADDCLFYRTIESESDTKQLQEDLSKMTEWSKKWLMRFNAKKCHDECCVRFLLDFFAAFIEVPPKECQNANCFGGSLVNVVVPVEVIP
jgi:hypothetical protein